MDKAQNFFDPYNFSMQQSSANMQNSNLANKMQDFNPSMDPAMSPMMYYEQQYMYYRYLNEMLTYKMKQREWEKMTNNNNGK